MTGNSTYERVIEALKSEQFDVSDIKPETRLVEIADSMELASLVLELEDEFGVEITDDELKTFFTIKDIVNYVDSDSCAKRY